MAINSENNSGYHQQQITYNHRERMVGFFVFSGFVLFLLFILISVKNQHLFEKRVEFYIDVNSSEGITEGSVVKALGVEVGSVSALNLIEARKVRVTIEVYEQQRKFIRKGATALVNRLTNIGSALIEIESDSMQVTMLKPGSIIPVEETPSLNDLLLDIASLIQSVNNKNLFVKFESILPKVEQTLGNVHEIIAQIASGHGTLGAAVFDQQVESDLKVVVKSGADILSEAEGIISIAKKRLLQLEPVLSDAQSISSELRGTAQNIPEMVVELNGIIKQIKTALALVNGELENIPGVAVDVRRTLSKTDQLLEGIQSIWPLSKKEPKQGVKHLIEPHAYYE